MTTEVSVHKSAELMRPIAKPTDLIAAHEELAILIRDALKENVDYGRIPGVQLPTLLKPGAERLNLAFGTHPEYTLLSSEIDHNHENIFVNKKGIKGTSYGLYRFVYKCKIVTSDGRVIAEGEGLCSTMESKYIWKPRDHENVACKMAQKRAFVAATLHAFGLSSRFTQDVEDIKQKPVIFTRNNLELLRKFKEFLMKNVPGALHEKVLNEMEGKEYNQAAIVSIVKMVKSLDPKPALEAEILAG